MSAEGGDVLADGRVENLNLEDDIVNPWEVASKSATGVDYDKLISMIILSVISNWIFLCTACSLFISKALVIKPRLL